MDKIKKANQKNSQLKTLLREIEATLGPNTISTRLKAFPKGSQAGAVACFLTRGYAQSGVDILLSIGNLANAVRIFFTEHIAFIKVD